MLIKNPDTNWVVVLVIETPSVIDGKNIILNKVMMCSVSKYFEDEKAKIQAVDVAVNQLKRNDRILDIRVAKVDDMESIDTSVYEAV